MNSTHQSQSAAEALQSLGLRPGAWAIQGASRLAAARAGWLVVTEGRVWLTRDGGGDDHVLKAGERLWLRRGERVVVESWQPAVAARLGWRADLAAAGAQPGALAPRRAGAGRFFWLAAARGLRGLGAGLLAAARNAEARALRAQGCIAAGESMASSGAAQ